jgi:hypothetical protein
MFDLNDKELKPKDLVLAIGKISLGPPLRSYGISL